MNSPQITSYCLRTWIERLGNTTNILNKLKDMLDNLPSKYFPSLHTLKNRHDKSGQY